MNFSSHSNIKKVVLVNPPMRPEQVYGSIVEWGSISPPTGLCYIAAFLREKGYDVSIIDAEALKFDTANTVDEIVRQTPDMVGIACKTLWIVNAHTLACKLKERIPQIPIVAGGNHVTALPEKSLKEFPSFDILIHGEGELTLLELVETLNTGGTLQNVAGLAFRDNDEIHITPPRERIRNLDDLPFPAYDLLPEMATRYTPVLTYVEKLPAFSIVTSRGCPGQCTFCDRKVFGNRLTKHSPEYILALIKELYHKYGIRYLVFDDDNLLVKKTHLFTLLDLLEDSGLHIPFTCQSRVDTIDEERLIRLKKAGCRMILYGIESGSQRILDTMKKNITIDQIYQAVSLTKQMGLKVMGFFIVGYPGETEDTLKETEELIKNCKFDDVGVFLFTPLPGSEIYNEVYKYGMYDEDWEKMNSIDQAVFIPHSLTADMLKECSDRCYNICYFRFSKIMSLFKRFHTKAHAKAIFKYLVKNLF